MEKRGFQRGSVRRFRISGTDEQNHQRAHCTLFMVPKPAARHALWRMDGQTAVVLSGLSPCYMSVC